MAGFIRLIQKLFFGKDPKIQKKRFQYKRKKGAGKVILIGAGPGDPELLTIKAQRFIQKADVILYDYLVHPNIKFWCNPNATLINVGKRKGHHEKVQTEINELMKEWSQKVGLVVRLKGGDPMVFGRVGEEMAFLKSHNIPYEIIPGISSAIAVPTYAGIPITHRDLSRSVAFVTGSAKQGDDIADLHIPDADTLIFLMPVTNLAELTRRMIDMPRFDENTPAMLIESGTTAKQRTLLATLGDIAERSKAEKIMPPAILVIGKVAELSTSLSWREELPLYNKRIWVLRAPHQGEELVTELRDLGAEVFRLPVLDIEGNDDVLKRVTPNELLAFTMLIFTSPNAVSKFMKAMFKNGGDARSLGNQRIIAVGPKTEAVLKEFGIQADAVPEMYQQEGVIALLKKDLSDQNILIPGSSKSRTKLRNTLKERGANVDVWNLYSPKKADIHDAYVEADDIVVFTSPSTVTYFFESLKSSIPVDKIKAICIGNITATEARKHVKDRQITIADQPTTDSMLNAILNGGQK